MRRVVEVSVSLVVLAVASAGAAQAQIACESLKGLQLPDVKITEATASGGASAAAPTGRPGAAARPQVPMCTVNGVIGREIKFSVQMPDAWNGKFAMGGQGNIAGTVSNMAAQQYNALGLGYATAGTDTGHAMDGQNPPTWAMDPFLGPERQVNFFHAAIHRVTVTAKAIVAARYGRAPDKSYFAGCSNGGRQGLVEVQRYPDDFDAALISAPSYNIEQLLLPRVDTGRRIFPDAKNWKTRTISNVDRMALAKAVLAKCDKNDGLEDGILSDPTTCTFKPEELACKKGQKDGCLSPKGVDAVRSWWAGVKDSKGKQLTPGFPRGGEGDNLWMQNLTGVDDLREGAYAPNSGLLRSIDYLGYFMGRPDWDYTKPTIEQLLKDMKTLDSGNGDQVDLSAFRKHGGKILLNHGETDATISYLSTNKYIDAVYANDASARNDLRYFQVPGMGHCGGGPGPQRVDWLTILDKWATGGQAPDEINASFAPQADGKAGGARKLCAYPKKQVFKGSGDGKSPDQFECK
ncbi:MAG TPA: tannase/feruloyl esterase family alpha/beta hydrolase [Hyphomonadaceae bacterium]|nr:tannase/feruloyl esterase family alpha/beta hydrolase [Hyphomonadaceae bacterium]